MACNTTPIFLRAPQIQWSGSMTTANTDMSMATSTSYQVFAADATNGSKVEQVTLYHLGTNPATVVRFFINNGGSTGTAANNSLVNEVTMASNGIMAVAQGGDY